MTVKMDMNLDANNVWTQFIDSLVAIKDSDDVTVKQEDETFNKKLKELKGLVKDMNRWTKDKRKLESEMDIVDKAITKANQNIQKAQHKCAEIDKYIEKMLKKNDENKENVEQVMNVWNAVGLRLQKTGDHIFDIKFSHISDTDPNKWFGVKISLEDKRGVKVIECDPKDCLDTKVVENELNDRTADDDKPDLRHLIAFIRFMLKKCHSK